MKVAHCKLKLMLGPSSNTKNWFIGADHSAKPPGQYSDPVNSSSNSAAAREYVLWPLTYPANGGVTKLGRWYGHQRSAKIQSTPASSINGTSM